tara:strand:+ start:78 stop:341 length:264 start_codon:yes stop_codon:yes gene_type:complete
MNKETKKVYAVLNEDRGGDTDVTIHFSYESAKSKFNQIVKELKENAEWLNYDLDSESWELAKDHLQYDFNDLWGNIKIYERKIKGTK